MKMDRANNIELETGKLGVKFLAGIPYDAQVEEAIGDVTKLRGTAIAKRIRQVAASNIAL
jgi:hypothetical protein